MGGLPFAMGPLSDKLAGHDVALVLGAPVFRYYPYVAGPYLPPGLRLLHISDDPAAATGDSDGVLSAAQVFTALNELRPDHAVLVEESPSNLPDLHTAWPVTEADTFYTFASGGLGWDLPAAVGIALAERDSGRSRPVIAVIGDGSFQYSVQSIWTAARLRLPMLIVVVQNSEYAILKSFARLEQAPGVPGLDVPGLDIVSIARGYGCDAARVADLDTLKQAVTAAWTKQVPTVLEIPISGQVPPLV